MKEFVGRNILGVPIGMNHM